MVQTNTDTYIVYISFFFYPCKHLKKVISNFPTMNIWKVKKNNDHHTQ